MGTAELRLERIVKGFANHRRIEILGLLRDQPEMSVQEVCDALAIGVKTGSEHLRKLAMAGLVAKRHAGRDVRHKLTPRAVAVLQFLQDLQ